LVTVISSHVGVRRIETDGSLTWRHRKGISFELAHAAAKHVGEIDR
jgi:hypothetical protein